MHRIVLVLLFVALFSCKQEEQKLTAQEIVDKSITVSGGLLHKTKAISFDFRDRTYISTPSDKRNILQRIQKNDTINLRDVLDAEKFQRFSNDSLVVLSDSLSRVYSNSVNSVHYFSKLPFGLNDAAVQKELLGEIQIKGKAYYKVKVTFNENGGGDDFDDTYLYWFNKETFKVDYLAYDFLVNGGGMRFREAYNERYVAGIRFVDYYNSKPKNGSAKIMQIDSLFIKDELELLSKIELDNVVILAQDSYN